MEDGYNMSVENKQRLKEYQKTWLWSKKKINIRFLSFLFSI